MLTHAGLFSGIGGFSLAAEWLGWQNVFEVELDPFCRQVLHKNFPHSQLFTDVCTFDGLPFRGRLDVLSGGFPCQPFSSAGQGLGTADARALWPQMRRVIREVQPRYVVGENVRGLLSNDGGLAFEQVCAELEAEGYDVQPFLLPACGVDAIHRRDRFWFVAHAHHGRGQREPQQALCAGRDAADAGRAPAADADLQRCKECYTKCLPSQEECSWLGNNGPVAAPHSSSGQCAAADAAGQRCQAQPARTLGTGQAPHPPDAAYHAGGLTEPALCGPDDGLPSRLVRTASPRAKQLKAYGNAIVPQVAFQIFQAIQATLSTPY